jgi:hypothetical protein
VEEIQEDHRTDGRINISLLQDLTIMSYNNISMSRYYPF